MQEIAFYITGSFSIWNSQKRNLVCRMSPESHFVWQKNPDEEEIKMKGFIITGHGVRVHAELAVVDCFLIQTGLQPFHHRGGCCQAKQALWNKQEDGDAEKE